MGVEVVFKLNWSESKSRKHLPISRLQVCWPTCKVKSATLVAHRAHQPNNWPRAREKLFQWSDKQGGRQQGAHPSPGCNRFGGSKLERENSVINLAIIDCRRLHLGQLAGKFNDISIPPQNNPSPPPRIKRSLNKDPSGSYAAAKPLKMPIKYNGFSILLVCDVSPARRDWSTFGSSQLRGWPIWYCRPIETISSIELSSHSSATNMLWVAGKKLLQTVWDNENLCEWSKSQHELFLF